MDWEQVKAAFSIYAFFVGMVIIAALIVEAIGSHG